MRNLFVALVASLATVAGVCNVAAASPVVLPVVAVASSSVNSGTPVRANAMNFCAWQKITFTISGPGGTFTSHPKLVRADGTAHYTFPARATKKVGTYTITADQRPRRGRGCDLTAMTTVKVKKSHCRGHRSGEAFDASSSRHCYYGYFERKTGDAVIDDGALVSSSPARADDLDTYGVQIAVLSDSLTARSSANSDDILPVTGSDSTPTTRVAAIAIVAGVGMLLVARLRRRAAARGRLPG
jgi:hypothetical protein